MYYNVAAGSFLSKKLCSRLHSIEVDFYCKKGKVRFLSHPHSSSTEVALASCSSQGGVKARVPSPPVVGWTNTVVSSFRHSAYYQHWPSSASISVWEDMCRSTHTQQLRRQKFFSCRSSCVERLAIISVAWHELQPLQACTERTYV